MYELRQDWLVRNCRGLDLPATTVSTALVYLHRFNGCSAIEGVLDDQVSGYWEGAITHHSSRIEKVVRFVLTTFFSLLF